MPHRISRDRQNRLWETLPEDDRAYLQSISRLVYPEAGSMLVRPSGDLSGVWFPHAGLVALMAADRSGRTVQAGLVGSDGCIGLGGLFPLAPRVLDPCVQVPGPMSVIPTNQLRDAMLARPAIQSVLAQFLYVFSMHSLQAVACYRLHALPRRSCRWLLTIQDHLASRDIPLTQEALAALLGSGRPRVNAMLAELEQSGLVQRKRGSFRILRRAGLKSEACDCYRILQNVSVRPELIARRIGLSQW